MALEAVVGIGITVFLLLYIAFNIDKNKKEAPVVRFLFILLSVSFLTLVPTYLLAEQDVCEHVQRNTTTVNATVTEYQYEWVCESPQSTTLSTVYQSYMWFLRIFWVCVTFLLIYWTYHNLLIPFIRRRGV